MRQQRGPQPLTCGDLVGHERTLMPEAAIMERESEKLSNVNSLLSRLPRRRSRPPAGDQQTPAQTGAPQTRSLNRISVRTRILAAVVGLAAVALVVAGYTAFVIQQINIETRINAELQADAEQFRVLHEVGVDPSTGEDFASPTDLVRTAMERIIPTRNEGIIGLVDGRVRYTSPVSRVPLEEDRELIAALGDYAVADRANFTSVTTSTSVYRVAVVPVHDAADSAGAAETTEGSEAEAGTQAADGSETTDGTGPSEADAEQGAGVAALVIAYDLAAERAIFSQGFKTYAALSVVSLLVVGLVGWLVAGRLLHPIRVLATTARRIGREDISQRIPVAGGDDLAEMTRSVNDMLERLEGAFRAQDQLIHDVSHELRTPLTILRGHLEVLDVGDPEDVTATRELTLDELTRMNRVVDDLTTLAQAEHPGFVLPGPQEAGRLTDEVYDKARGLGERPWLVEHRAEGDVIVDRERLTQAWLQLAANAVKFSPPDSAIALGSRIHRGELRLWVRDQGVGIAEEDRQRIFTRFARADSAAPGSGLGLPIVAAIARAHGGEVTVDSEIGVGTVFTMVLPVTADTTAQQAPPKE